MAQLRVVMDQLGPTGEADLADASLALVGALAQTAPPGCTVEALLPADGEQTIDGVDSVHRLPLARRELAMAWQLGIAPGVGGGMIHSPTPLAPLVRHDRVHDHDQIVPTFWDLRPWTQPDALPKGAVSWQRGMLRRAVRHADAVVVPSHAIAGRLADLAPLGDRIRVISGAPAPGLIVPSDAQRRRGDAALPARYAVVTAASGSLVAPGFAAAAAADIDVVVLDAEEGAAPAFVELAVAAGLHAARVHVRERFAHQDRASIVGGAAVFLAADAADFWPWRLLEAMSLGVPVVAVDAPVHHDVVADGGRVVPVSDLTDAVAAALEEDSRRLSVLAEDRARAFSWLGAAEQVWALHADL